MARDVVAMARGGDVMVSVRVFVAVFAGAPESVTWNVSDVFAVAVGAPAICPVVGYSVNPFGNAPAMIDQVYDPVPPVAASVCEYAAPTCPFASDAVAITSGAGAMVKVRTLVAVRAGELESVTRKVSGAFIAAVGVPLIWPVDALSVSPFGSAPAVSAQV